MSLKKIEQVKKDKGFKIFDLIIYGVIALTVAVLFIVIFATRNSDPLTGIKVYVNSELVFEYEFDVTASADDGIKSAIVQAEEESGIIKVTVTDGDEKNVFEIDKKQKTVKMVEANCKGKQCLYFPVMNDNSDFIYCSPHRVRIEPFITRDDGLIIM